MNQNLEVEIEKNNKLTVGIINLEKLVDMFGTKKHKENYIKNKKLSTSNKETILKNAQRYCDIEEVSPCKYRIISIYDIPKPKNLNKLKKGVYNYMAPLILLKLLTGHDENNKVTFPLMSLATYIDLININYKPIKYNMIEASSHLDIDIGIMNDFFERVDDSIKYYIENCLDMLKKADVLIWYKVPMIRKRDLSRVYKNDDTDINLECRYVDIKATDEEVNYILKCSETVRKNLGIIEKYECFYGAKAKKFRHQLGELLKQRDILYFYDCYEVFYTNIDRCNLLLKEFDCVNEKKLIKKLNQSLINMINENAQKRHEDSLEKFLAEELLRKFYRIDKKYIDNFQILSNLTINHKEKRNISKEINIDGKISEDQIENDFNIKIIKNIN